MSQFEKFSNVDFATTIFIPANQNFSFNSSSSYNVFSDSGVWLRSLENRLEIVISEYFLMPTREQIHEYIDYLNGNYCLQSRILTDELRDFVEDFDSNLEIPNLNDNFVLKPVDFLKTPSSEIKLKFDYFNLPLRNVKQLDDVLIMEDGSEIYPEESIYDIRKIFGSLARKNGWKHDSYNRNLPKYDSFWKFINSNYGVQLEHLLCNFCLNSDVPLSRLNNLFEIIPQGNQGFIIEEFIIALVQQQGLR